MAYSTIIGLYENGTTNTATVIDSNWNVSKGAVWSNSGVPVLTNNWTHVQIVIDCPSRTYDVTIQPVFQSAQRLGISYSFGGAVAVGDDVYLMIYPQGGDEGECYFDNPIYHLRPLMGGVRAH